MSRIVRRSLLVLLAGVALAVLLSIGPTAAFHWLPPSRTGEAQRLATVLELAPGSAAADIGAGDGRMALEIARAVGSTGLVYATEISEEKRERIANAARVAGLTQLRVVAAGERTTGLPDRCCDAIYLRTVLHHVGGHETYAAELKRALKAGGRLAIIDFSPGAFLHLPGNHGVTPERATTALTAAGFRLEQRIDDWGGRLFLLLFRS
jgi:ubiquinone/menaquinone biosynthesis C-methylase UbiE